MLAVETQNLCKAFGNNLALDNVNLRVEQGSIYGLLGPNGAGKTTTLEILLGLKAPTSGRVLVAGCDIAENHQEVITRIGYVAEESNLYGYMKVCDLIEFCAALRDNWSPRVASACLDLFSLPIEEVVANLSMGMRKQLALLLALAAQPDLLILDEPTAGLDPLKKRQFYSFLVDTVAENQRTVLLATHDLADVERVADTIGILVRGKLRIQGRLDEFKTKYRKGVAAWENDQGPLDFSGANFVRAEMQDGMWVFVVADDRALEQLKASHPRVLHIHQMSLEDVALTHMSESGETDD